MSSIESTSWHKYPKLYALGHGAIQDIFMEEVIIEEKVDGCVTPDTPILKSDLEYVRADELKIGDKLLAFTDELVNTRLTESEVTFTGQMQKECAKITFKDGRKIIASLDHPWLTHRSFNRSEKKWVNTAHLKKGTKILALPYWERDNSWESGYLAGMFDGEGSLVKSKNQRVLSVYQREGTVLNYLIKLLKDSKLNFNLDLRKRQENYSTVGSLVLRNGSWTKILEFLGRFRPLRLLEDSKKIRYNAPINYVEKLEVISIKIIGKKTIQGLSTSSKTYIAKGLFSHNSQFSFGIYDGELKCRSKGVSQDPNGPDKLFLAACNVAKDLFLRNKLKEGYMYSGEYLRSPKHNTLAYDRIPKNHIILFDVRSGHEKYLSYEELKIEAERLELEVVPLLYKGKVSNIVDMKDELLDKVSCLGGQKIEGFVVKNYSRFSTDGNAMMGKFVSEAFKEVHQTAWKDRNPQGKDFLQDLCEQYKTEARWNKAVQHLKERGALTQEPKDIGPLIKEVSNDILEECRDEIKEKLFKWAWPHIQRTSTRGLPEWFKEKLMRGDL